MLELRLPSYATLHRNDFRIEIATLLQAFANAKCTQRKDKVVEIATVAPLLLLTQNVHSAMTIGNKYAGALDIDREIVERKLLLIYNSTYIIIYL